LTEVKRLPTIRGPGRPFTFRIACVAAALVAAAAHAQVPGVSATTVRMAPSRIFAGRPAPAAIEKQLGMKDYSFTSFEGYIGAKVMVEAMRKAGAKLTREAFMRVGRHRPRAEVQLLTS
jgi:hypothetical protein